MKDINAFLKLGVRVEQYAPNHLIIYTEHGKALQSYDSVIVFVPYDEGGVIYLGQHWDYSRTTGKYRNRFLGMDKQMILDRIKDGRAVIKAL